MTAEDNKHLIRGFIEDVYVGDVALLDQYVSEDDVDHAKWKNREGLRKTLAAYQAAYPDRQRKIEALIAEGDKVAVHVRFELSADPDRTETLTETLIFRVDGGKIVEHWGNSDSFF